MSKKYEKCNHTVAEIKQNEIIEYQYQNIMKVIKELLLINNETIADLCTSLEIHESTFYRYKKEYTYMDLRICISAIIILKQKMAEKHLACTPQLKEFISQIDLFIFD